MARSFYCQHCGAKVSRSATRCSQCGRLFGAVLCPRCGFSGEESLFARGCPSCGYLDDNPAAAPLPEFRKRREGKSLPRFSTLFYLVGIGLLVPLILFLVSLL